MSMANQAFLDAKKRQQKSIDIVSHEQERVARAEDERGYIEGQLGTEAQVNGQLGTVPAGAQGFTDRYQVNDIEFARLDRGKGVQLRKNIGEANDLLEQAQMAASEGRMEDAERLRTSAQGLMGNAKNAKTFASAYRLGQTAEQAGNNVLSSPEARIVGRELQRAREYQNWDSEESQRLRDQLGEGANRSLAMGQRESIRTSMLAARRGGVASNPVAQAAAAQRSAENFGAGRAQVASQVATQFEQFRTQYAKDSVSFAREWTNNAPGVRDNYNNMMNNLGMQISAGQARMGDQIRQWGAERKAEQAAKEQARNDTLKQAAGIALSIGAVVAAPFTGGASLALLGASGSMMKGGGGGTPATAPTPGGGTPSGLSGGDWANMMGVA